ncbi:MAG: TatD family hydrolase [Anaerolineales bacterium]|nr:TatD family hydrolase [Anaerolineales bacterium]
MLRLTDTHCHLDFDSFDADRDEVLQRASDRGVEQILIPGLDLASSRAAVAFAEKYEIIFAAVGVHPNSAATWEADTRTQLAVLAQHPKVVAIGEIGLDFYWDTTPKPLQRKVFRQQLELAAEAGLPVVIHDREAHDELIPLLVDWQENLEAEGLRLAEKPGVMHSYSGNIRQAQNVLQSGYYLGITGPVTFDKAIEMQQVALEVPQDRLLIETDAPFLTPHPYRGKRNEPSNVYYTAEKIASLRGISIDEVGEFTSRNAKMLFNW